jgi:hypothetical protein
MNEEAKKQFARERSMKRVKTATYIILGISALLAIYLIIDAIPPAPGKYDKFAQCIADTGTKFYGAFWCPHCADQKREFGDSVKYLPYIECSLPDESGQTQVCIDNKIESYPTWEFPDKSRLTGTVALSKLAEKTGCSLTDGSTSTIPATPTTSSSTATTTQAGAASKAL